MIITELIEQKASLAVVGLGYVGLPLAIEFARQGIQVIGFDTNKEKIKKYKQGIDPTFEVGNEAIRSSSVQFTFDETWLSAASFIIVAVPTPVKADTTPDLHPLCGASEIIGQNLRNGAIVCFESTVYPGITEGFCKPIIERESGKICGRDWKIAYSPERINPGDKVHRLTNIKKIVSGMDENTTKEVKAIYDLVVRAGTFAVSSIKTAEAVKVVENSQRDINIAFMNEIAMICHKMGIDTNEVIEGMNTKWNALGFRPGLVGGHCIGVDPYYLTSVAERLGYHSQIIENGRHVNDSMGEYVADAAIQLMVKADKTPRQSKVAILGLTFKENCPDLRNSKVFDIIKRLNEYGIRPIVSDAWTSPAEAKQVYGIPLTPLSEIKNLDCLIIAVDHEEYRKLPIEKLKKMYKENSPKILLDVKSIYSKDELEDFMVWRL